MKIAHPTWIHPGIEIRDSPLHGRGSFAVEPIRECEIVTVWAHTILDADQAGGVTEGEFHRRADGLYVWLPESWTDLSGYDPAEDCVNHSCEPNVWMNDEVTLSARRDVAPGEEMTGDYALWEFKPEHVGPFQCRCGSPHCRGQITGQDWKLPELQRQYSGHWHPSIERKIESNAKSPSYRKA
jgi:uncharacterized protein